MAVFKERILLLCKQMTLSFASPHLTPHNWQLKLENEDKVTQRFKLRAFRPPHPPNSCLHLEKRNDEWGGGH